MRFRTRAGEPCTARVALVSAKRPDAKLQGRRQPVDVRAMSSISGAMGAAQAGMNGGLARMGKAAEAMTVDVSPEAILESKLGEQQFKASAKVAVAIDRSLGVLIDTLG